MTGERTAIRAICASGRWALVLALVVVFALCTRPASADENDPVDRARYELASKLYSKNQFEEARAIARLLVTENPRWLHAWILLGTTYSRDPETYDLAEDAFKQARKLDEKSALPLRSLAALASSRRETDKAADLILQAAQIDEQDLELQVFAARTLVEARRMAEAKQRYDIVLEADPDNIHAVSGYGALLVDLGEYSRAVEIYKHAIESGQKHVLIYNNLVDALVRAARYDEAVKTADVALAIGFDPLITLHKARALTHLGKLDEAASLARDLVENKRVTGEQAAFALYQLGTAEALRGCGFDTIEQCQASTSSATPACCNHLMAALDAFEKAAAINPRFRDVTIRLGLAQFAAGKLEDAEATLKNYIEQKGDKVEAEAFGALAVTLYRFGEKADIDEAVRVYREARELAPDFDDGTRLARFRLWPPYAITITEKLRTMASERDASASAREESSCGCVVVRAADPAAPLGAALALATLLLGVVPALRRRGHCRTCARRA